MGLEGEVPNPSPVRVLAHIPPIPAQAPSPALEVANRNPLRALNEIFKFFKHLPVLKVPPQMRTPRTASQTRVAGVDSENGGRRGAFRVKARA